MADFDTDGLYPITWDSCDGCDCSSLFGSPQDTNGRGILLTVTRDGEAVDLSDSKYNVYFLWLHRQQHTRGIVEMTAVDASAGKFSVYFPSGMIGYEGEAVCSVVLSWGDKTISTPTFSVRIDEALVSTLAIGDGFTLFAEALKAYEAGTEDLLALVADLTTMRDSGEFDGKDGADGAQGPQGEKGDTGEQGPAGADGADGKDGSDGVSCTHSWDGTVLTVISASGTSSADLVGPQGPQGEAAEVTAESVAAALTAGEGIGIGSDGTVSATTGPLVVDVALSSSRLSATSAATYAEIAAAAAQGRCVIAHVTEEGSDGSSSDAAWLGCALTSDRAEFAGALPATGYAGRYQALRILIGADGTTSVSTAHVEGWRTSTTGAFSHAEGLGTTASGPRSHAEGSDTAATGMASHAEGNDTSASGAYSHAEGDGCLADGYAKHAQGAWPPVEAAAWEAGTEYAVGDCVSYGGGLFVCTEAHTAGTSFSRTQGWAPQGAGNRGRYAHVVGNGTSDSARSAAHTLEWDGTAWYAGDVYVGGESGTGRDDGSRRLCTVEEAEALSGADGKDGADGVSVTHSWDGTVLTVTSASGTSSADLVGPQGPQGETGATGETGPQGPAGADGTTFTPASPLSLGDGTLSIDLSAYATQSWVKEYLAETFPDLSEVSY